MNAGLDSISDAEELLRLLSSPSFYDEETNLVTVDAFDLRVLKGGKREDYASLARLKCFLSEEDLAGYLSSVGYKIWDDKKDEDNHYYGYGVFNCGDAREVHEMIEIKPLSNSAPTHVGLFYKKSDGSYYCGPLPKTDPDILEVLSDLASLLKVSKAPERVA